MKIKFILALSLFAISTKIAFGTDAKHGCEGNNSLAAIAPTAVDVADGIAFVWLKRSNGTPVVGQTVEVGSWPDCTSVCNETDSSGRAFCAISCPTSGAKKVFLTYPTGIDLIDEFQL